MREKSTPPHPWIYVLVKSLSYLWVNMNHMRLEDVWVERHAEFCNRYKNIPIFMCLDFRLNLLKYAPVTRLANFVTYSKECHYFWSNVYLCTDHEVVHLPMH